MATAPAPPPLPPPPCRNQYGRSSPIPCPGYAAMPYSSEESLPVQETSPSSETLYDTEDAAATPPPPVEDGPQFPPSQGQQDSPSDSEEKYGPVQETDPAPQALNGPEKTEQQDEAALQMDQAAEDQLP